MKQRSEFLAHFVQQHGPRETGILAQHSDQQLKDEIRRGKMAEAELENRRRWDEMQRAALYAWSARDIRADVREALELIATPMRPDGTWNRDREACRQLAAGVLGIMEIQHDDTE